MMNTDETNELNQPLSILQRLDRLEILLLFLEKNKAGRCVLKQEEQYKSLFYAFEEVHHKGTLLERVALLENRLMQLSMNFELENTSRSSSSTSTVAEQQGQGSGIVDDKATHQDKEDTPLTTKDSIVVETCSLTSPSCRAHRRRNKAMSGIGYNRKWSKWLKLGC